MCRPKDRTPPAWHPEGEQRLGGVPGHLQAAVQQLVGQPPAAHKPEAGAREDGGNSTDRPPAGEG